VTCHAGVIPPLSTILASCLVFSACGASSESGPAAAASGGAAGAASASGGAAGAASASGGAAGAVASAGSGGGAANSPLVGSFQVKLSPASASAEASANVVGKVYDGPTPAAIVWENPRVDGACVLTTPRAPFCSTPCGGSSVCIEDDTCLPYPTSRGVGPVTVTGLKTTTGEASFIMTAIANTYQPSASVTLAFPPFAEGEPLTFAAAGDYFPAFSLTNYGILPLALSSTELTLKSGQPLNLSWLKGASGIATVHVKLDISHHGGSKGQIECDASDSGALSISAALLTQLLGLGVAGFPTVIVTRQAVASTAIAAGRVELVVSSVVEHAVSIDGLTSCTATEDCPSGQVCQSDLTCK